MLFNLIRIFTEWRQHTHMKIKEPKKSIIKNNSFDSFVKYELGWIL
jgi:hypothetical protein